MHDVIALYATGNETTELRPAPSSREATLSSGKEKSFNVTAHNAKEGTKGGKKRRKQRPQWITATTDYDGGNDEEVGGFGVGHIVTATCSSKCQARSPIDHFERLLEEACPNHEYPIKNKLKDCGMMKNFLIS
jgi:hypothetical protein